MFEEGDSVADAPKEFSAEVQQTCNHGNMACWCNAIAPVGRPKVHTIRIA